MKALRRNGNVAEIFAGGVGWGLLFACIIFTIVSSIVGLMQ